MASLPRNATIMEYQNFIQQIYGKSNDRHFSYWDMMSNVERFTMRGLKGIRKGNINKTKHNLLIAMSWFASLLNRLHIDLESETWRRFPYLCSYCGSCPCACKETRPEERKALASIEEKKPKSIFGYQTMFREIYQPSARTVEHAGVHLAEELGELSEALLKYWGGHLEEDFENIQREAADFFSCIMGVFSSLEINTADELASMYFNNCHDCHRLPCECNFTTITQYRS